eukprot:CAMPEP_0178734886 /NCGR_PEP_ID=MMETSP0744-20121128/1589_1 /TAXON_ID=913974 /ORGANISM="Nitzschia punctata, Strain CCMP561" /LENGTH=327 /DNA_ID=CAMNT_0020387209 /DNA_START=194 /DNA_END=1177 /DNA_ORIENTATION=+
MPSTGPPRIHRRKLRTCREFNHFSRSFSLKESSNDFNRIEDLTGFDYSPNEVVLTNRILEVAIEASNKACAIIRENLGAKVVSKKSTERDLLTLIDALCEKTIRHTVQQHFPNHSFLGEETVPPGIEASQQALEDALANTSEWLWIVDPIDGTTNFASGIPLNMPSIAVARNCDVLVSVLNDPHRRELYTAVKGQGAFLNGQRIQVGKEENLEDAIVGAESPAGAKALEMSVKGINQLMPQVRTIRMLGSSAVFLPWVASGRLTAYWTPDECAWDIAAGALLVSEAGGRVTDAKGYDYTLRTRSLVASNGMVHDDILAVLREAEAIM